MRTYLIEYNGIWLGGYAVVTAGTEPSARKLFLENKPELKGKDINGVYKVDTSSRQFTDIFNGDY